MKFSLIHKLSLGSFILMLFIAGIVGGLFYIKTSEILVNNALRNISDYINQAGSQITTHLETQRADTLILAEMPPIQGILRSLKDKEKFDVKGQSSFTQWSQRLSVIFKAMLFNKPDYLKIRFIDASGQEIVVVGREGNELNVIPDAQLQNKSKRVYFTESLKLEPGKVYISDINLNREYGKVSVPYQEVIRTSTLVYDKSKNKVAGLILITSEVGHELRSIAKNIQSDKKGVSVYITNDHGGYILHPDPSKMYGFDLGRQYRIQEDIPYLAKLFLPGDKTKEFILRPDYFDKKNIINFSKVNFDAEKPQRFITIGVTQLFRSIVAEQTLALNNVFFLTLLIIVPVVLIAAFYSYRLTLPIKRISQYIKDYSRNRNSDVVLPVEQNDEIGLMAKSFQNMTLQIIDAEVNLKTLNKTLEARVAERTLNLDLSERRQRNIVENIVDGLITIDEYGVIETFNPAAEKIFGYRLSEVVGKNVKMLMPEPYHSEHDGYLEKYQATHVKKIIGIGRDVEGIRKDGTIFPMELAVSEMLIDGKTMYTGIVRDITERKQIDKMKNEFISTVSHELRTPLTSIRGSLGLLLGGVVGELSTAAKDMLKIASNNTERLLVLINDILDIQKIESGQMVFKFQNLAIMPFLEQAIQDNAAYGDAYNVKFVISKSLPGARVFADKDRLSQVMANLLSNAAKFSNADDIVEISIAKHHDSSLRISVTDFGSGIPEAFQPKLFERFTQSDSSDTRAKGGTGLGLSITKVIVEKHGGNIGFISREGIGSTFYIELPELMGEIELDSETSPRQLSARHKACVLIVEDDPDVAMLLKRMLAESGYNCEIAYDAEQARQKLQDNPKQYKAITLDLVLPGEDGLSLLEELRREVATQDIPVVVVSVKADEAKRSLIGGAVGVVDWLQKPIDQSRLISAVKQAAGASRLPRVLHVEDEIDVHTVVNMMLREHCDLTWTTSVAASKEALLAEEFDLVLLDINLPDGSGLELLETIEDRVSPPRVVIFSAYEVTDEYAKKVNAVLMKSKTNNQQLAAVINNIIHYE